MHISGLNAVLIVLCYNAAAASCKLQTWIEIIIRNIIITHFLEKS